MKKHEAVTASLKEKIQAGIWRPNERLPSQAELAAEYGISLGTMQKCIQQLVNDGILQSIHGSGTYVTTDSPPEEMLVIWRFRDETGRLLPLFGRVESVRDADPDGPWQQHLGTSHVLVVERIISINLKVFTKSRVYLRCEEFDKLKNIPLFHMDGHDLTRIINKTNGGADHFKYYIRGGNLSNEVTKLNHLDYNTNGIYWEMYGFGASGRPVWYQVVEMPLSNYAMEIFACVPRTSN